MPKLDRYLSSEIARSVFAALVVLGMVSFTGLFADLLGEMASGKVPPPLLLSQLGLRLVRYLPLILPLALLLGYLLALGRLYRDSEMHVLAAVGVGPRRLLRPVMLVALPVLALIALSSLWLGPWADRVAQAMVAEANKNLLVAGLEPGRFTPMANGGVAYAGTMSADGSVGPIGGIQQKMVGAQNDGAEWFLAPAENCSEVVGHVPDGMRVVRVATFAEGWAAVKAISQGTAANLPTCA